VSNTALEHTPTTPLTKKDIEAARFVSEYLANNLNGTKAYLAIRPDVTHGTAGVEACRLLKTPRVQDELNRQNKELEVSALVTRAEVINKMKEIGNKAEKSKAYTPAISAWKEAGTLSGVYDRDDNEAAKYTAFVNNLTVNVHTKPQDVVDDRASESDIEADWEDVLDNQGVTEQD
jgi:hypothetical protein